MSRNNKTIVIIGGGITGLTAAYYLQQHIRAGQLAANVILLEAEDELGGKIRTRQHNGFIMETGADSIVSRKAAVVQPIIEQAGLQADVVYNATGKSYLHIDGGLAQIPEDTLFGIPLSLESLAKSGLVSAEGKVAALRDYYTPNERYTKSDSVGSFLTDFLGRELVERQIAPVLSGVYSGSLDKLTIQSTLPYLLDYKNEYGSIIAGLEANHEKFRSSGNGKFFSFSSGLSRLVQRMEQELTDVEVRKGVRVERLHKRDGRYSIELADGAVVAADEVVLAVLHRHAQAMLADRMLDQLFTAIPTGSLISVYLGYEAADAILPENGTGFIVAGGSDLSCDACTWTSRKWSHTSANQRLLVRLFYKSSNPRYAEMSRMTEEAWLRTAQDDVKRSLGLSEAPVTSEVTHWQNCMPQYEIRHHDVIRQLEQTMEERYPGVLLAGCSYYGVGVPDCMENGMRTAERIVAKLSPQAQN